MVRQLIAVFAIVMASNQAPAALLGRAPLTPGGTDYQAYYDSDLDITWLANANLAATNSFGVAGVRATGQMDWNTANAWVGALNSANYLGMTNWRLPTVVDTGTPGCDWEYSGTDCGYNVDLTTGEMAHLYYSTLGNDGLYDTGGNLNGCLDINPYCLTNTGPFSNLVSGFYWSGTIFAPYDTIAWGFYFHEGSQRGDYIWNDGYFAWAVRAGDIAAVPLPSAAWIIAPAFGMLGWVKRRRATANLAHSDPPQAPLTRGLIFPSLP